MKTSFTSRSFQVHPCKSPDRLIGSLQPQRLYESLRLFRKRVQKTNMDSRRLEDLLITPYFSGCIIISEVLGQTQTVADLTFWDPMSFSENVQLNDLQTALAWKDFFPYPQHGVESGASAFARLWSTRLIEEHKSLRDTSCTPCRRLLYDTRSAIRKYWAATPLCLSQLFKPYWPIFWFKSREGRFSVRIWNRKANNDHKDVARNKEK